MKFLIVALTFGAMFVGAGLAQNPSPVPTCPNNAGRVGEFLLIKPPARAPVRKETDIDYFWFAVVFAAGKEKMYLEGIFGFHATSGEAPQRKTRASRQFSERTWSNGDVTGVDARGIFTNGRHWRYFGTYGAALYYDEVTEDAARYFDKVIDTVCVQYSKKY